MREPCTFIDSREAAKRLGFVNADGAPNLVRLHKFCYRYAVPRYQRGRSIVFDPDELDRFMRANLAQAG